MRKTFFLLIFLMVLPVLAHAFPETSGTIDLSYKLEAGGSSKLPELFEKSDRIFATIKVDGNDKLYFYNAENLLAQVKINDNTGVNDGGQNITYIKHTLDYLNFDWLDGDGIHKFRSVKIVWNPNSFFGSIIFLAFGGEQTYEVLLKRE